ncbi:hypothetical protein CHUAL_012626 [Chamberlinius hualienensis]
MYKELFLLAFVSSVMMTSTVDSTSVVCDELLRIFDDKTSRKGTLGRIRNAINRACTALDLLRHGINPLDLIRGNDDEVTKRTRRTKKPVTEATTTAAATSTTIAPAADQSMIASSTVSPLELILKHPQVNIIFTNSSDGATNLRQSKVHSRDPTGALETRVAVDAPRHLLPLDFNPHDLKRPYPAVYEVRTKFVCEQQPHNPGVYADMSLGCKVFHLCAATDPYHNRTSFYCPDTLLFNQEMLRCDYPKNVNCHESYKSFQINENFNKKFDIKYVILGPQDEGISKEPIRCGQCYNYFDENFECCMCDDVSISDKDLLKDYDMVTKFEESAMSIYEYSNELGTVHFVTPDNISLTGSMTPPLLFKVPMIDPDMVTRKFSQCYKYCLVCGERFLFKNDFETHSSICNKINWSTSTKSDSTTSKSKDNFKTCHIL